jgi:hypothetical protein
MSDRAELIVQCFAYLVNDYGFHIEKKEFAEYAMGNAVVVYKSSLVGIEIAVDRGQVLISMGDQADQLREWFEFSDVLKYYDPSVEKAYILPEKTPEKTWDDVIEDQIKRLAIILRQYCEPFLKGDLSGGEQIKQIEKKRTAELFEHLNKPTKSAPRG